MHHGSTLSYTSTSIGIPLGFELKALNKKLEGAKGSYHPFYFSFCWFIAGHRLKGGFAYHI
jgi:hypothetical protein